VLSRGSQWLVVLSLAACAAPARFPLREAMTRDPDERPFSPAPEEYVSPFAWDAANQTVFRPLSRFFAVDPAGPAANVNALDEVPDSSWFQNRLGKAALTAADVVKGPCSDQQLDPSQPNGAWVVDKGKDNGANPGFRVNVPGAGKFMLKGDIATEPDRATGATAISTRIYHAAGYFAACDSVVYFRPSILSLKPGLSVTNNQGVTTPFDQAALERILALASHRDGLVRMASSAWLPGKPIGPYKYDGLRDDDPNDVIPHEDRRELRGARLIAAWLNHFDSREQNTLDVFVPADSHHKDGPGHVVHYIIDIGDSFGSVWSDDAISRQLGHAYLFDVPYIAEDFVTLGTVERPWERARRDGGIFNYFSARDFDPELWRGEYPNPAFSRMTEADGAWAARIIARFTDELVAAAVSVGKFDDASSAYLTRTLLLRRDAILRRYLSRLSPLADVVVRGQRLEALDLARRTGVAGQGARAPSARLYRGGSRRAEAVTAPSVQPDGRVTLELAHGMPDGRLAPNDPARYVVLDVLDGFAPGPLRVHLYDLGPRAGFRLVGIERPETTDPPR
jgi:hypothetical protein